MTACGYFWTCVLIALAVVAVTVSAVRAGKSQSKAQQSGFALEKEKGRSGAERVSFDAHGPVAFRRGAARIVRCEAVTRLDDGYFVGMSGKSGPELDAKARNYAKKELAALLAEQALAAGGIRFVQVGGELHAELRAIVGEVGE